MEKTSREYAEKLAEEMYPIENYSLGDGKSGKIYDENQKQRTAHINGYLKAVEETNVKELREALEELTYELTGDQEDEQELEKGLGITLAMRVARAINALNKTKS